MVLDKWIPFFTKLVWPTLIVGLVAVYHADAGSLVHNFAEAIKAGRSVRIGDLLEIGAGAPIGDLVKASAPDLGRDIDISVSTVGGYQDFVEKGSYAFLDQLRGQLQQSQGKTIDVLVVSSGREYSTKLLRSYVATLGIRYVVFRDGDRFAGWMEAGLFNSQLPPQDTDERWSYAQLHDQLLGRHDDSVSSATSALDVLKKLEDVKVESIAIVDDGHFKSIVTREGIIAKLLAASILEQKKET